jgi:hypothetical protein
VALAKYRQEQEARRQYDEDIPQGEDPYSIEEEYFKTKSTGELVCVIISMILYIVFVSAMLFGISALGLWYADTAAIVYLLLFVVLILILAIAMFSGIIAMIKIRREDQEYREAYRDNWVREKIEINVKKRKDL